jgi:hypothetical protein
VNVLLVIGPHRFVLRSAAIASAIVEALKDAPQVSLAVDGSGTKYVPVQDATRIDTIQAVPFDAARIEVTPPRPSPLAQAVLGDRTPKARRETRAVLLEAADAIRSAKAKRPACPFSAA